MFTLRLSCCRRADRRLRLVAVATDDSVNEKLEKDSKMLPEKLPLSSKVSNLFMSAAAHQAKCNHYEPEPRAPDRVEVKVTKQGQRTNVKGPDVEYCPMNGSDVSDYLEPAADYLVPTERTGSGGYVPMGPPPGYDNYAPPDSVPVTYSNTESGDLTIDMAYDTECVAVGYDIPPPMNIYSEIPDDDGREFDDDEKNHIYESLDQPLKPQ